MRCPICQHPDLATLRTEARETEVKRRRKCTKCGHRWTTIERAEADIERDAAIAAKVRAIVAEAEEA